MVLADHAHVLREVVADRFKGLLELVEEILARKRGADVHRMRGVEVQRDLVRQLGHLHVDAGVHLAAEVGVEHLAIGRVLLVRHARDLAAELPLRPLRTHRAGKHAHAHSAPRGRHAGLVLLVLRVRPQVHAKHADRRMRIQERVAARDVEPKTADHVQPALLHVFHAFVVPAVHEVERPVGYPADRLHPHLKRAGVLPVRRHREQIAPLVRRNAHAVHRLRDAQQLFAPAVNLNHVVNVAVAIRLREAGHQIRPALLHREIDVARADRHDLHQILRSLAERRVEEQHVHLAVMERLHRPLACGVLDVLRRELRVLEIVRAVAVPPLRHRRVANPHARPFGDLCGHHGHRPRRRRVQRVVHASERLQREVVALQQLRRAERRADHVHLRCLDESILAERHIPRRDVRVREHARHHPVAELHVGHRPVVQLRIPHGVRNAHLLAEGAKRSQNRRRKHHLILHLHLGLSSRKGWRYAQSPQAGPRTSRKRRFSQV